MKYFFIPQGSFSAQEWMLRYKVMSLLIISFIIGVYISLFGIYRLTQHTYILGLVDLLFGFFLLIAFIKLRADKKYYELFAKIFFVLVLILLIVLFLFIPEPATRIHWAPAAIVFIFFLLDYKAGILFLGLYITFILYLLFTGYDYSFIEYTTWISSLLSIAIVMYYYEKVKEKEKSSLLIYASKLKDEVNKQTKVLAEQNLELHNNQKELTKLNIKLEERVEEELKQRLEQEQMLLQQCRLASMGEMIDSIAHQWRQPLMNINAILMTMDRAIEIKDNPKVYLEDKMEDVISLTTHMSQTIEDFRSLFKKNKEKSTFILADAVQNTLGIFKDQLKNVTVTFKNKKEFTYYGYNNELTQVIIILISNALDALTDNNIMNQNLYISLTQKNTDIIISIEDNAGGINTQYIQSIFDPYFTTKERMGGTGLGLYVAKIIIEQNMHGKLSVQNTNKGAKFTILLKESNALNT